MPQPKFFPPVWFRTAQGVSFSICGSCFNINSVMLIDNCREIFRGLVPGRGIHDIVVVQFRNEDGNYMIRQYLKPLVQQGIDVFLLGEHFSKPLSERFFTDIRMRFFSMLHSHVSRFFPIKPVAYFAYVFFRRMDIFCLRGPK